LVSHFIFLEADQDIATNSESYIPRLSRDSPTKVVVAKKQFDGKAAYL